MPENEKTVGVMKPLEPWAPITQECIDLIEKIPESCSSPVDKTGNRYVDYFERCQKPIDAAVSCLETKSALKCLPAESKWSEKLPEYLVPFFKLATTLKDPIGKLDVNSALNLATALRSVFLVSVARCEPSLIEEASKLVENNVQHKTLQALADYLEKTKWTDLTKRLGVGFGEKGATLLLMRAFALKYPNKSSDERLDMALNYFPPQPVGPVKY